MPLPPLAGGVVDGERVGAIERAEDALDGVGELGDEHDADLRAIRDDLIAVVELDEQADLRLPTNIVDSAPADLHIGAPVRVRFEQHGEVHVPVFAVAAHPVGAA